MVGHEQTFTFNIFINTYRTKNPEHSTLINWIPFPLHISFMKFPYFELSRFKILEKLLFCLAILDIFYFRHKAGSFLTKIEGQGGPFEHRCSLSGQALVSYHF